ncbi:MAG: UvrD-helicase domain-containing protein [Chloroflexi bacterium]|nr:UvrD-helicase domain-containing protein [Chloroflexota bacterium]
MSIETSRSQLELNPDQLQAVNHGSGPLLIIAGAGTGKTRTLIGRLVAARLRSLWES